MIKIENLCKSFDGKEIIKDLSFTIEENKCTVFTGVSGTGKTTLLNIISGLIQPDSGSVSGTLSAKKTFVFQENRLLENRSTLKNILCVANDRQKAADLLEKCGLGNDTEKKAGELSGGMKRRLAIARALAYGGDMYFMDEPLRELDEKTLMLTAKIIKEEIKGKTAIIITHDNNAAEYLADRIITFADLPMKIFEDVQL